MIQIHWEVNGIRVDEANFEDVIISAIMEDLSKEVQQVAAGMVCPEHGEQPEITVKYQDGAKVAFNCKTCCEPFGDALENKLAEALGAE